MVVIRPFQNSDTHGLALAWRQHWDAVGVPVETTYVQLEQAILDKPFFEFDHMLVIEEGGHVAGFAHLQTDTTDDPPIRARIASFCVGNVPSRAESASALLEASIAMCARQGIREFAVGTVMGDLSGLVGLEPYAGVVGMMQQDRLMIDLLESSGFAAGPTKVVLELELGSFRAPLDRELLMLRRTANVVERAGSVPETWRAACAHSHFDITRFELSGRAGQPLATASYYLSDPDSSVMNRGLLYLAEFSAATTDDSAVDLSPQTRYVVVASLAQMAHHNFRRVRAVVDHDSPIAAAHLDFLGRIGFQTVASGSAYHRVL